MELYLIDSYDSYPGESQMFAAVHECVDWNREACRCQDERPICWLSSREIEWQRSVAASD